MKNLPPSELSRRRLVPSKRQRKVPKDDEDAEVSETGPADEGHVASDALNDFPPQKVDDDHDDDHGEPAESESE